MKKFSRVLSTLKKIWISDMKINKQITRERLEAMIDEVLYKSYRNYDMFSTLPSLHKADIIELAMWIRELEEKEELNEQG